jgi:hypothetical protein
LICLLDVLERVRQPFRTAVDVSTDATPRVFAAHRVAAAVLEARAANRR